MTILNIYLPADRQSAMAAIDTQIATPGTAGSHGPKFLVLPHVPAVLLHRGSQQFGLLVWHYIAVAPYAGFDQLCALLPYVCRRAAGEHGRYISPLHGVTAPEITALGWSQEAGGYAALHFCQAQEFVPIDQPVGCRVSPAPADFHIPPQPMEPTIGDLVALGEMQIARTLAEHGPDACQRVGTGGDLIAIELAPEGVITARKVHQLSATGDIAHPAAGPWWHGVVAWARQRQAA